MVLLIQHYGSVRWKYSLIKENISSKITKVGVEN